MKLIEKLLQESAEKVAVDKFGELFGDLLSKIGREYNYYPERVIEEVARKVYDELVRNDPEVLEKIREGMKVSILKAFDKTHENKK